MIMLYNMRSKYLFLSFCVYLIIMSREQRDVHGKGTVFRAGNLFIAYAYCFSQGSLENQNQNDIYSYI